MVYNDIASDIMEDIERFISEEIFTLIPNNVYKNVGYNFYQYKLGDDLYEMEIKISSNGKTIVNDRVFAVIEFVKNKVIVHLSFYNLWKNNVEGLHRFIEKLQDKYEKDFLFYVGGFYTDDICFQDCFKVSDSNLPIIEVNKEYVKKHKEKVMELLNSSSWGRNTIIYDLALIDEWEIITDFLREYDGFETFDIPITKSLLEEHFDLFRDLMQFPETEIDNFYAFLIYLHDLTKDKQEKILRSIKNKTFSFELKSFDSSGRINKKVYIDFIKRFYEVNNEFPTFISLSEEEILTSSLLTNTEKILLLLTMKEISILSKNKIQKLIDKTFEVKKQILSLSKKDVENLMSKKFRNIAKTRKTHIFTKDKESWIPTIFGLKLLSTEQIINLISFDNITPVNAEDLMDLLLQISIIDDEKIWKKFFVIVKEVWNRTSDSRVYSSIINSFFYTLKNVPFSVVLIEKMEEIIGKDNPYWVASMEKFIKELYDEVIFTTNNPLTSNFYFIYNHYRKNYNSSVKSVLFEKTMDVKVYQMIKYIETIGREQISFEIGNTFLYKIYLTSIETNEIEL